MSATLLAHKGSVRVSRAELATIEPPAPTQTWTPVKHFDLVQLLTSQLCTNGRYIVKEEFAVQRDGKQLFGVMDLNWGETQEHRASLGLRTSNDKTMSIQIAVGARVFVCDNLLFSGELIALARKHTRKLDLERELQGAVRRYEEHYGRLSEDIEDMQRRQLCLTEAKALIFNVFATKILPLRLFPQVSDAYSTGANGTVSVWELHNRCTSAMKKLSPAVRFKAHTKLGKFFGLN